MARATRRVRGDTRVVAVDPNEGVWDPSHSRQGIERWWVARGVPEHYVTGYGGKFVEVFHEVETEFLEELRIIGVGGGLGAETLWSAREVNAEGEIAVD